MYKRVAAIGFLLALCLVGPTPAHGQGAPCYPPPCGSSQAIAGVEPVPSSRPALGAERAAQQGRSAPFVVGGLLMVSLSFGLIMTSRSLGLARSAMAVQGSPAEIGRAPAQMRPPAELSDVH